MRRRGVADLTPGMVIAKPIYLDDGRILLAEGAKLTSALIDALINRAIGAVYVRDAFDDRDDPVDQIMEHAVAAAPTSVARLSRIVAWAMHHRVEDAYAQTRQARDARARTRSAMGVSVSVSNQPLDESALDAIYQDITSIFDQVLTPRAIALLEELREYSPATFEHSIDVAIVSILIAMSIGLSRPRVRCLALGCLLHDIGKLRIERAILEKPARLTPAELERFKEHPAIGYAIVHGLKIPSPLPAAVVVQHHERQDGGGYPAGLVGTNRIFRTRARRLEPGQIMLLAEIATVADVYTTLVLDAPHRPALPISQVVPLLRHLSGSYLNQEIVETLLSLAPVVPVERWVQVIGGAYDGWQGIVTRVRPDALMRPTIQLLIDDSGSPVRDVLELDLYADPTIRIALLSNVEPREGEAASSEAADEAAAVLGEIGQRRASS